jgi:hypothetical protein
MRRLFWLGIGLALGVLIFRKLSRVAEQLTPRGLAQSLGGALAELSEAVRDFAGEVRETMHEHEQALREGAGLDSGGEAASGSGAGRA